MLRSNIFFISVFFFSFCLTGCAGDPMGAYTGNANSTAASPTPSEDEQKKISDARNAERIKALDEFIVATYPGWRIEGMSDSVLDCDLEPCDVKITKGKKNKVLSILIREFRRSDGTSFWSAFEARWIDMASAKIRAIKSVQADQTRESVLANLEWDDCEGVFEAMQVEQEMQDDHSNDPY